VTWGCVPRRACRTTVRPRDPSRRMVRTMGVLLAAVAVSIGPVGADTFSFSGDRTEVVLAEGRERTLLEGNARVVSNDVTLEADEIELSGTDFRYAELRGGVRVIDSARDLVITAGDLSFDRETENSRARESVMVEDNGNDLLLKGGYLETRDGGDLLFVQVAVRVLRDDLTARAQFLRYRRVDEVLELSGFPVVYWKGDEYRASRIVLNLETEEIELQGRVEGEIEVESADE
jgi:lipopolysaccharide export system protein LptA